MPEAGLICAAVVSTVYVLFGRQIYRLYSDETVILDYGVIIMNILSVLLFFQILQVVQFGCLRGAGDTGLPPWCPHQRHHHPAGPVLAAVLPPGIRPHRRLAGHLRRPAVRFVLSFIRFHKGNWTKLKL